MITVGGAEWRRIEDYMNEHRDCTDNLYLHYVISAYYGIYKKGNPFFYDYQTGETRVKKADAIAAAQLYCDIPDDF